PKGGSLQWGIIKDGQNKVLGIISNGGIEKNRISFSQFNICWFKGVQFGVEIEIRMKAVSGKVDQGGGPIWRVFDSDNYYVARANPLEGNFRVYYVRNGKRVQIASTDVDTDSDKWYTIKIVHRGDKIEGYLNGRKYIEVKSDMLPNEGGIGVWTKADALSYFDDIKVTIK
ncbi:MAG: DUF1080 domain-containing protein, partial [Nitrospirae bacterium]|nr:DUF1080 domain-containing protein [Nitrospirota bacterium]